MLTIRRNRAFMRFVAALCIIAFSHQTKATTTTSLSSIPVTIPGIGSFNVNFESPPFWVTYAFTCAAMSAGLSIAQNYYRDFCKRKSLKVSAATGYYAPSQYQQLITATSSRHIPLILAFDMDERTRTDGNTAISSTVTDVMHIVADVNAPMCIITTASVLLTGMEKSLAPQAFNRLFTIFDLRSKGADLVLLVPRQFNNKLLELFNVEGLARFDGEQRMLAPWLEYIDNNRVGMYNDKLKEIFCAGPEIIWDIYITGHGSPKSYEHTLGFSHQHIQSLLALFNTTLRVGLVYLSSCYLPGPTMHAILPTKNHSYTPPLQYPVIIHGVYDAPVYGMGGDIQLSGRQRLLNFFNNAASVQDKGASLDHLLVSLVDTDTLNANIAQVLLPGQEAYYVFGKHPKVLSLGKSLHQRKIYEQLPLEINQEMVLVYEPCIDIPLHVHSFKRSSQAQIHRRSYDKKDKAVELLPRHDERQRYPQFVCMQQEQGEQDPFNVSFNHIVLYPHDRADKKTTGVFAFISDAFRTFNKQVDLQRISATRSYYIASITGPNDSKHWFNAMGAVKLSPQDYKDTLMSAQAGNQITLQDIHINYYSQGLFCPAFTLMQFICAGYRYSCMCTDTQMYWTVNPATNYASADDARAIDTKEIIIQAQRHNMRERVCIYSRAAASIKKVGNLFTPLKDRIHRSLEAIETYIVPTVSPDILNRLLQERKDLFSQQEYGAFVGECMERISAHPVLDSRLLITQATIVELIEHNALPLQTYEAYLTALLPHNDKVDANPLLILLGKNLYVQEIAAMVQRLIARAGVRKIRDTVYMWAGLSLKQAVVFKDIVTFTTCTKDRRSLLKHMTDLVDSPCDDLNNHDKMQLLLNVVPVMLDLLASVADDPELTGYAVSAIESAVKLLVEHAVIDQAQADAMLEQAQGA